MFCKAKVFAYISLTRNTLAERISDIFANLDIQLKNKVKSSTDISDVAQLAIFICHVETLSLRNSWGWCL